MIPANIAKTINELGYELTIKSSIGKFEPCILDIEILINKKGEKANAYLNAYLPMKNCKTVDIEPYELKQNELYINRLDVSISLKGNKLAQLIMCVISEVFNTEDYKHIDSIGLTAVTSMKSAKSRGHTFPMKLIEYYEKIGFKKRGKLEIENGKIYSQSFVVPISTYREQCKLLFN